MERTRKWAALALAALMLTLSAGSALATQEVALPDSRYVLDVPDWMRYVGPGEDDECVFAYVSEILEMDVFSYEEDGSTQKELGEKIAKKNPEFHVELREIQGLTMVCYQGSVETEKEEEKASCVGFVLRDGKRQIEMVFWYSTEDSFRIAEEIIDSIH